MQERGAAEQDGFNQDSWFHEDFKQTGQDRLQGPGSIPIHANESNPKPSSICRDQQRQRLGHYETLELSMILN